MHTNNYEKPLDFKEVYKMSLKYMNAAKIQDNFGQYIVNTLNK